MWALEMFLGLLGGIAVGFLVILIISKIESRKKSRSSLEYSDLDTGDESQIDRGFILFDDNDDSTSIPIRDKVAATAADVGVQSQSENTKKKTKKK